MSENSNSNNKKIDVLLKEKPLKRRSFLKALATAGAITFFPGKQTKAFAGTFTDKKDRKGPHLTWEKFFQKYYKEMTPEDKKRVFERITRETKEYYGVDITLADPQPIPGVKFVFFLNLSKCNGNRRCVIACQKENNLDRSKAWITVLEMENWGFDFEKSDLHYTGIVPKDGKFYLPVQCLQCDNPPCVKVCPTEATWKEKDGIVVIDYDWCIGCRYCQAACPYEARKFNWRTPEIPKDEINPNQSYLGNRIRPRGTIEKCHFCSHRTRVGKYPACLEACPTGARKFGNILDPDSEVSKIFKTKTLFVLKEELNTIPQFFYYFG